MLSKISTVLLLLSISFVSTNADYAYAADVEGLLNPSQFNCFKSKGYSAVFTQIYATVNGGSVNKYGSQNVIYAHKAGLATEVYIDPSPQSIKPSYTQFDEAYYQLTNANISVRSIWLKVTKPLLWNQNVFYNINFIKDIITRAQSYNVNLGIYTNWYDWDQITGSTTIFQQYSLPLWYWNTRGFGSNAETSYDFDDFVNFGGWFSQNPKAKEYGLIEWSCSTVISEISYHTPKSYLELLRNKNLTQPVAGSAIL
uniref:Lysozyme n=1 Tax=Strongyloides papillosus TaxID=174720 RepID=A0A0N5BT80_STREA